MNTLSTTLNTFFQNTCVIVVFAYVLTRSRLMPIVFAHTIRGSDMLVLGSVFGLMSLVELFFASSRFPYDSYTLIITFATVNAGLRVGLLTAATLSAGSLLFLDLPSEHRLVVSVLCSSLIAGVARRLTRHHHRVITVFVAMLFAEAATIALRLFAPFGIYAPFAPTLALARLAANGVGIVLLQLIVNDAQTRAQGEQFRAEAEHSRALAAEAQFAALRARVNPHFLYNTLSSIAALCSIAPDKAEETITRLGSIMRRSMENHVGQLVTLRDELDYAREYVEIEQLRYADRLRLIWSIQADCLDARVPPFAIQLLVENAINHGIGPSLEAGTITVTARRSGTRVSLAVQDNGVGMNTDARRRALQHGIEDRYHGMQLLNQQLVFLYSAQARLRVFSRPQQGTCVVFFVPALKENS